MTVSVNEILIANRVSGRTKLPCQCRLRPAQCLINLTCSVCASHKVAHENDGVKPPVWLSLEKINAEYMVLQ